MLALVCASPLLAGRYEIAAAQVPPPPANVTAAKAYAVLERNCAGCHQTGRLETPQPAAGIANILALDEVARDPGLVRAGVPDASRLYGVALAHERHHDVLNDPALPVPTAAEVQTLRDWIADLTPRTLGECARRPRITADQLAQRLAASLSALSPAAAQQTRFVSLAGLHNDCATRAELDGFRQGLRALLAGASRNANAPRDGAWPRAIDAERVVLSVALDDLGWSAAEWEELASAFPLRDAARLPAVIAETTGTKVPIVPADWLAAALQTRLADDKKLPDVADSVWGLPAPLALARAWDRPADFNRAAADLWLEPTELSSRLQRGAFDASLPARQLLSGGVATRERLIPLLAALAADVRAGRPQIRDDQPMQGRLDIALWTEAPTYRVGDTAVFNVATSRDCHLTLVNVDRSGRAIVLFPNEFEPDNLIRAGRVTKVPSFDSPYRFRFRERGRELAVAICSLDRKAPAGIVHDYDRQRFTTLGDWQLFLREPPDPKAARSDDAATEAPRADVQQRRRGRRAAPARPEPPPSAADEHTRTAITIDIE